jgi:hypothetical protein
LLRDKVAATDRLERLGKEHEGKEKGFTWTAFSAGLFFDWVCVSLSIGCLIVVCGMRDEGYTQSATGVERREAAP